MDGNFIKLMTLTILAELAVLAVYAFGCGMF